MNKNPNIVLVGFMGTGKTTVGKALAARLGMQFLDMDDVIEEREGIRISRIFADKGEPCFRAIERDLVRELAARSGLVIGTGGGIVLNPDNVTDFSHSGLVVCLTAAPEAILRRVEQETQRPLLAGDDKMEKIRGLLGARQALYDAVPYQVDTSLLSVEEVADRIQALYESM